jgi:tetratricopeptide (TPR) repeat protein
VSKTKRKKTDVPAPGPEPSVSGAKRRVFRWVATVGAPILMLLATEFGLRLFGYGYPTHFFLKTGSDQVYAENEKFGWRFFPRRLSRSPDPIRLARTKPAGTVRIFVFGESAALGDPQPAYGFSRILRELLEARCAGTHFEVINTGMTAINSHAVLSIARDCVPMSGDVWILYMGNNEVVGPFGAGSVFGAKAPPLSVIRASLALKRTCLGQALDDLRQRVPARAGAPTQWEGMKMMTDQQIRAEDPVLNRVYDHFGRNLNDILSIGIRAGIKPIVCSVGSNLRDCPPFASLNRIDLTGPRKAQWDSLVSQGAEFELKRDYVRALSAYAQASHIDSTYAALAFRTARCDEALGRSQDARAEFVRARDLDALRFRCDTVMNRIIRKTCSDRAPEGIAFLDSESVLTNACQDGIPGAECFWDHVHFNFKGNYLIARELVKRVLPLLQKAVLESTSSNNELLTETQCAERLAYTDWDQRLVLNEMLRRVKEPPFTAQLDHADLVQRWSSKAEELGKKLGSDGMAAAEAIYRTALLHRPDDWILHNRLGFLLEARGDIAGAAEQWNATVQQIPEWTEGWFKLGDMAVRQGNPTEAELYYRRVLTLRPESFEALNGLGLLFMDKGDLNEAIRFFQKAIEVNPKFAQVHVNWGLLESRRGNLDAAEAHYREALRCDPDSTAAHIDLGNLLAAQQKHTQAIEQYSQALRVQPNEAAVHLSLANSLAATGKGTEAETEYQETIRLNPGLAEAHFNLGVALAKRGNLAKATESFQEACRLNPQDAQAHMNLGVALAQQHRFREAVEQFQQVLRLDPGNADAHKYIQMTQSKAGSEP